MLVIGGLSYLDNVEDLFLSIEVIDTPVVRRILELIEQATYLSSSAFIDRFGYKLPISALSTGCKAALVVLLGEYDKWISMLEVGTEACSVIVSLCDKNKVLFRDTVTGFVCYAENIDVMCEGRHFNKHDDFTLYLLESGR